jgi:hypothetical protein
MISEVDETNTGLIRFSDFLGIYWKHKYANLDGNFPFKLNFEKKR